MSNVETLLLYFLLLKNIFPLSEFFSQKAGFLKPMAYYEINRERSHFLKHSIFTWESA